MTLDDLRALKAAGWGTGRLARLLGVDPSGLRRVLKGTRPPDGPTAATITSIHGITEAPTPERPDRVLIDRDVSRAPERDAA